MNKVCSHFIIALRPQSSKPLEADGGQKQMFFSYHAVDVHAGLEQGLDGAVVSVACSQVKRSVSASVAGHKVGVSAYQHAHHLCIKTQPYVRDKTAESAWKSNWQAEQSTRHFNVLIKCQNRTDEEKWLFLAITKLKKGKVKIICVLCCSQYK